MPIHFVVSYSSCMSMSLSLACADLMLARAQLGYVVAMTNSEVHRRNRTNQVKVTYAHLHRRSLRVHPYRCHGYTYASPIDQKLIESFEQRGWVHITVGRTPKLLVIHLMLVPC